MEGSVFETKGLNPSSNYDHWTKWTERVCPNSDLDTALTCFWSVLLCRNWLVEFSDQELVYRLETSPNYLFPRKIFFHITVNHFFNVIGNWTTLDKWGATQVRSCLFSLILACSKDLFFSLLYQDTLLSVTVTRCEGFCQSLY